jgi:hypothetical protein
MICDMCIVGDVNMTATEPLGCSAVKVGEAVVETSDGGLGDRRIPGMIKYLQGCSNMYYHVIMFQGYQLKTILPSNMFNQNHFPARAGSFPIHRNPSPQYVHEPLGQTPAEFHMSAMVKRWYVVCKPYMNQR